MTKITEEAAVAFGKALSREEEIAALDPGGFGGIEETRSQKLIEIISNAIDLADPSSPMSIVRIDFANGSSVKWGPGLYGKSNFESGKLHKRN